MGINHDFDEKYALLKRIENVNAMTRLTQEWYVGIY